ncbi:alpha/beta-hydrolase [Xylariaceae sp. FL1272]|nr:alpha/beta-hydrolase [Xylariaceae sp. FL1272]
MSEPSFVFATGSFAPPEFYDNIVADITAKGYEIKVLQLPTVGPALGGNLDKTPPTLYDDAKFIKGEVEKLADAGKEVILVAHSYGGMPATESTKGLSLEERQAQGKQGGLVRLAYKTCVVGSPGECSADVLGQRPGKNFMEPDENGWLHLINNEDMAVDCFNDMPRDDAIRWQKLFTNHSGTSFTNQLTHPGYKDVPVSYLFCEQDNIVPPAVAQRAIDIINSVRPEDSPVDVTRVKSGHCPTSSIPDQVVDWLLGLPEVQAARESTKGV